MPIPPRIDGSTRSAARFEAMMNCPRSAVRPKMPAAPAEANLCGRSTTAEPPPRHDPVAEPLSVDRRYDRAVHTTGRSRSVRCAAPNRLRRGPPNDRIFGEGYRHMTALPGSVREIHFPSRVSLSCPPRNWRVMPAAIRPIRSRKAASSCFTIRASPNITSVLVDFLSRRAACRRPHIRRILSFFN